MVEKAFAQAAIHRLYGGNNADKRHYAQSYNGYRNACAQLIAFLLCGMQEKGYLLNSWKKFLHKDKLSKILNAIFKTNGKDNV